MKVIEKLNLDEKEQEALHTEIAVLRLVNHRNILNLKHVFETRRQIFIITNMVSGGDLFERLDKIKKFSQTRARDIFRKLLHVVEYLHSRGVVHRDLKPENILCSSSADEDNFDIILGDFGLAHFAGPHQKIMMACGTPAYVAPEVWEMKGYDSQVDLWSAGVMLYLFLCGRLPFSGKDRKELQQQTQRTKLVFSPIKIWDTIDPQAMDLTKKLLQKFPHKRLTARQALQHPWLKASSSKNPKDSSELHNGGDQNGNMRAELDGSDDDARDADGRGLKPSEDEKHGGR
eukprot:jgi/Bigna1/53960/estExt_Genewise1Plus.C_260165